MAAPRKPRARRPPSRQRLAAQQGADAPSYEVLWHPAAAAEQATIADPAERIAIQHALEKLEALGPQLEAPHSSAVKGEDGAGLRELRPRAGRSRWRPIYRQPKTQTFVILAVAPEAQIDKRGFNRAISDAKQRLGELEL